MLTGCGAVVGLGVDTAAIDDADGFAVYVAATNGAAGACATPLDTEALDTEALDTEALDTEARIWRRGAAADAAGEVLFAAAGWSLDARAGDAVAVRRPAGFADSARPDVAAVCGDSASLVSAEAVAASPTATAEPMPSAIANAPMRPTR
jgi:hypothetical protein